jgi:hypothetical protein
MENGWAPESGPGIFDVLAGIGDIWSDCILAMREFG